jgi:hypothetical protein
LRRQIPDAPLTLNKAMPEIDVAALRNQLDDNAARDGAPVANLLSFFTVPVPPVFAEQAAELLRSLPFVEHAYVEEEVSLPAVNFADDPFVVGQGHFSAAPIGVDMLHAWTLPFADGAQVRFVDVEYGWQLTHEDLVDASGAVQVPVMAVAAASTDPALIDHGTKVLGIVMAQDNNRGIVGAAPSVRAMVAPGMPERRRVRQSGRSPAADVSRARDVRARTRRTDAAALRAVSLASCAVLSSRLSEAGPV